MTCRSVAVEPGQEYRRATLVHDGSIYDWVNCVSCDAALKYVVAWAGDYADEGISEETFSEWARDIGWTASSDPADQGEEQIAALAFLVRYRGTIVDHAWAGVAGHPDDHECSHRADGTDAMYCGKREEEHLWSTR